MRYLILYAGLLGMPLFAPAAEDPNKNIARFAAETTETRVDSSVFEMVSRKYQELSLRALGPSSEHP